METEIMSKLFLELSQVTSARTAREIKLTNSVLSLRKKVTKLKGLMLLTDDKLLSNLAPEYHQCGGTVQLAQWQEFIKEFPDEA